MIAQTPDGRRFAEAAGEPVPLKLRLLAPRKTYGTRQELRTRRNRAALVPDLGVARLFRRRARHHQIRQFLHPAAAAECHRHAAHGPRLQPGDHGFADALPPHARRQHAVAAGHRPRRHRDADRGGTPARRPGHLAPRPGPREVPGEGLGMEEVLGRHHYAPDAPPGHLARLVARALHDGCRAVEDRHRNFRPPAQGRPDLSRQAPGELGPEAAHGRVRPRSGERRGRRLAVAHPLSAGRRQRKPDGGHHPPGNHARRRRDHGPSRRRTLRPPGRQARGAAVV